MKDLFLLFIMFVFSAAEVLFGLHINAASGHAVKTTDIQQTGWTDAIPAEYKTSASRKGTVIRLDYESKDYAGNETQTVYR